MPCRYCNLGYTYSALQDLSILHPFGIGLAMPWYALLGINSVAVIFRACRRWAWVRVLPFFWVLLRLLFP